MASEDLNFIESLLPKEGAVLLLQQSDSFRGHIESRCLEKGLTLITGEKLSHDEGDGRSDDVYFDRLSNAYGEEITNYMFSHMNPGPRVLPPSGKLSRLRIVSDGLEARIFSA